MAGFEPRDAVAAQSLVAMFEQAATRFASCPAIDFLGRRWSYRQLSELVNRAARGLQDLGVRQGVSVGLCLPNTPYSVIFYYAVLKAGGTVVNFNPLYVERELKHQILDSDTTIMVVPDLARISDKVGAAALESGLRKIVLCPMAGALPPAKAALFTLFKRHERTRGAREDLFVPYDQVIARSEAPDPVSIAPHDVAVIQYTGGTTGTPKGAMLTHANLTANSRQVVAHHTDIVLGGERVLGVLPLFHVFGMTFVLNFSVEIGAEMILLPRFEARQVVRCIARCKPTAFPAVPTIYGAINAEAERSRCDLSSIRVCVSGGAPLPADVRRRFETLTGCKLVEGYGLTEASPVVASNPPDGLVKDGSVGLPMQGTSIEIRDPLDPTRRLGPYEKGEVCVRGPQVMAGYRKRPAETEAAFIEGALRTGDIGYLDDDGYLFLIDRIKDVILCGGFNVYPRVVEDALYQHPAVAEVVVVGVPDPYRGQAPKAFVALRPGQAATAATLRDFLADYLSKIELPREIEIRDSLPKTMVGKLSKTALLAGERAERREGSA